MKEKDLNLRELVRSLVFESLQGFLARTSDISYGGDPDMDPTFEQDPEFRAQARSVKQAWAAEADHDFMNKVVKIHWLKAATPERIRSLKESPGRDEISTMGYISAPYSSGPDGWDAWGKYGLVIKGKTTLAANSMDDLYTGYHKNIPPEVREKYGASGLRKRPVGYSQLKGEGYILDEKSFDPSMQGENEFVVANWRVAGFVMTASTAAKLGRATREGEKVESWQVTEWNDTFRTVNELGIPYLTRKHANLAREWMNSQKLP